MSIWQTAGALEQEFRDRTAQLQADAKGQGLAVGLENDGDGADTYRGEGVHPSKHRHLHLHNNNSDVEDLDGMEDHRPVRKNLLSEMKEVSGDKRSSGEFSVSIDGRRDGSVAIGGRCSPPATSRINPHPEDSDSEIHHHSSSSSCSSPASSTTFPYRQIIIPDIAEEKTAISPTSALGGSSGVDRSVADRTVHGGGLGLGPGTVTRSTVGSSSKPHHRPPLNRQSGTTATASASAKDLDLDEKTGNDDDEEEDDDTMGRQLQTDGYVGSLRHDGDMKRLSFSSTGR